MSWRGLWLAASCLLMAGNASAVQLPRSGDALRNEIYLPTSGDALKALIHGDRAILLALQAGEQGKHDVTYWAQAFESWHSALVVSEIGDNVPVGLQLEQVDRTRADFLRLMTERWPDRDGSFARRTESVELAVQRRLCGLSPQQRQIWQIQFSSLAHERMNGIRSREARGAQSPAARNRHAQEWRNLEREFPNTLQAFYAGLWLFEHSIEMGRPRAAQVWLSRARLHSVLITDERQTPALDRRQQVLDSLLTPPSLPEPAWTSATKFRPKPGHLLTLPNRTKPKALARIEGQPGLAFLGDSAVLVQTTSHCWLIDDQEDDRIFEPWRVAFALEQSVPNTMGRTGRDWPFFPLAHEGELYIVSGRADGSTSNILQRLRPPHDTELPVAVWSLGGEGLFSESGEHVPLGDILEPGMWEFQPGPILVDGTLYVQARRWTTTESEGVESANAPGEAQVWLLALDAQSGLPRWKRMLCRGTDINAGTGMRLTSNGLIRTPAQALRATRSTIFVGSNLGAGFLLDLADGRLLTSFKNDRRSGQSAGWQSALAPNAWEQPHLAHPLILWAPSDGLELFSLRTTRDFSPLQSGHLPKPFIPYPPLERNESRVFLGGSSNEALVLGKAGARQTLSAHDLSNGTRRDSIYLAREEEPAAGALVTEDHLLFFSDKGLYRLDRRRELYLEHFQRLRLHSPFTPGGLFARGEDLYLLAQGSLFRFQIR